MLNKLTEKLQHSVMKFDRSNKFELRYYGLKSCEVSKWASAHLWG